LFYRKEESITLNYVCSNCALDWYFGKKFQNCAVTIDSETGTWICLNERDTFYQKGEFQVPWKKVWCERHMTLYIQFLSDVSVVKQYGLDWMGKLSPILKYNIAYTDKQGHNIT
jgi:hypothetical protein